MLPDARLTTWAQTPLSSCFGQVRVERRLGVVVALFLVIIVGGALGYRLIEGWSWLDAFYMAAITVTTVGFGEVYPLSPSGRGFTIALVVFGVGAIAYTFSSIGEYVISGQLRGDWVERKVRRELEKLKKHYIICGFGRVGAEVAREFRRERQPVVVLDPDPAAVARASAHSLALQGDAGDDAVLHEAGIERARGVVAAADSDTTNVMIALSARAINPKVFIVVRAIFEHNRSKLLLAGADRVISPAIIGGRSMAQMALRPKVVEFLDVVTRDESMKFWIEDLTVMPNSLADDHTIGGLNVRGKTGAIILTLRRQDGPTVITPTPDTRLRGGDMLMAFGTREQLSTFNALLQQKDG